MHLKQLRPTVWLVVALVATGLSLPPAAEAHGHGFVFAGGFYGWGPYWGWGMGYGPFFGPYYPYYYPYPSGGVGLGAAMMAKVGALDLDVKPNHAEVWVDGKYAGEARDLDGYPSYLWLKEGPHHLVIYMGGYRRFEEDVDVQVAMTINLKIRLEKGESEPPGRRPGAGTGAAAGERASAPGELRLKVRPEDASIYVDGQFRASGLELTTLRLAPGHHRVEVVRPGFSTLQRDVELEAGHTVDLNLELERP